MNASAVSVSHMKQKIIVKKTNSTKGNKKNKVDFVGCDSNDKNIKKTENTNNENKNDENMQTIEQIVLKEKNEMNMEKNEKNKQMKQHIMSHLGEYIEEPYHIIESYFNSQHLERLVRHQIESYNHFINFQIQRTIQMFNPVLIRSENDYVPEYNKYFLECFINFDNFKLYPPQIHENNGATKNMLPQEARLRNFTYASTMTVDVNIEYVVRNTERMEQPKRIRKTLPKINIGKMPIMIKSDICVLTQNKHIHPAITGECPMDCGGYFIIKGSEKTVLGQERAAENKIYVFDCKNTTKWSWYAEIKSVPDYKCISPKHIEMMIATKDTGFGNAIYMSIPRIKQPIELFVVFRALGVLSDKKICEYILLDIDDKNNAVLLEKLQASIMCSNKYMTKESALKHITSFVAYTPINMDREMGQIKKREFALDVLSNDLFPHCRTVEQKLHLMGYMANKLIQTSIGRFPVDDRDSYVNKRIELTGTLLNNLFRNYFNKLVKELQKQVISVINTGSWRSTEDFINIINMTNIYKLIKSTTIENGINRALATGDFSIKQSNTSKVGVAQVLNRLTYLASLSHLRRINTPLDKSGELVAPRKLHSTTWGFLCLTGDTEILLSNKMECKKIKHIKNGDWVNTVNRETLIDEPSPMYAFFGKMPDKLFKITTLSGRTIKATAEHPFLVDVGNGKYEMKKVEELNKNDKMVIRHSVSCMEEQNEKMTSLFINENDVLTYFRNDLLKLNLLNVQISNYKLRIIARLLGAVNTIGNIISNDNFDVEQIKQNKYKCSFYLNEKEDVMQLVDDMLFLGFSNQVVKRNVNYMNDLTMKTWEVISIGVFPYFMILMGGFVGNKMSMKKSLPEWLLNSSLDVKREYLSSFQGGNGSQMYYKKYDETYKPHLGYSCEYTHQTYLDDTIEYLKQIKNMFDEFNVKTKVKFTEPVKEKHNFIDNEIKRVVFIMFDENVENMERYSNIFNYTYCDEKRRKTSHLIEHLKIKMFNNEYNKIIESNNVFMFADKYIYDSFIKHNTLNNGCVSIPIFSIEEIEPEMVYDFTTQSENHSFVASSFVSSNCPTETPEGQSIGVVKNISYLTHITIPSNSECLYEYVQPYICKVEKKDMKLKNMFSKVKVFVNGTILGYTENPEELYNEMKEKKYRGIINVYTSVVFDCKLMEIRICNDGGRLTRPVLRVKNDRVILTQDVIKQLVLKNIGWNDLITNCKLEESVIEYIDPEEQNYAMIAMTSKKGFLQEPNAFVPLEKENEWREKENKSIMNEMKYKYTHCEIHPSTIFGILASCIPFPEHNQSPRNTYQTAMQKQAIGIYAMNYDHRMDKTSYILTYPSKPLVETRLMNFIHLDKIPSGAQIHVAIMTHTGYNQEDSVLINKGSIDRGLFSATIYHTEKDEDKNIIRDEIIRCKPDKTKTKGIKFGNYDKLNSQGFIPENSFVENRDIIIAKIVPIKENRNDPTKTIKYEDQSKTFRTTEETYIDKNYMGRNGDGYNFAKVRVRTFRRPVIGDKFAARSAQKGTLGNIIPECDMPFTKNGMRPDLILNPHAIPSRMTIAQLKETLLGKVLIELGLFGDSTSFNNLSVYDIAKELQKLGYESYGNEIMYDGLSGEQMETSVFFGPTYYQRLKHMVNDKQHSRSIGPMVNLTRQPAEGRSRDGGFRIGEMERDVMIAHGMSRFCRERLFDVSDKYSAYVCRKCGMLASYNDGNRFKHCQYKNKNGVGDFSIHLCKTCDNTIDFAKVEIPYAYKLLSQELQTINVVPRLITE